MLNISLKHDKITLKLSSDVSSRGLRVAVRNSQLPLT